MDEKNASQTSVLGVTLEQYAGIQTALMQGFPLEGALRNERLSSTRWNRARAAWGDKLARDGHVGPLSAAFLRKSLEAADWLGRRIEPLDSDLRAWCAFLGAYAADAAPSALLQRLGLRDNDVQRLVFAWKMKTDSDLALAKKAAEIAATKPSGVPDLRIAQGRLRPFPWSPGPKEETPPRVATRAPSNAAKPAAPEPDPRILVLEVPSFLRAPEVRSAPLAVPVQSEDTAFASREWATGTVQALEIPRGPDLPFHAGEPREIVEGSNGPVVSPAAASSREWATGTAMLFELPEGLTLPFRTGATPNNTDETRKRTSASPPVDEPAVDSPAAAASPPALTLEQHASLCAELAFRPEEQARVLSRYRVTDESKRALDRLYRDRPDRSAAWDTAYRTYLEWLSSHGKSRV